jgi:hypothetical protein
MGGWYSGLAPPSSRSQLRMPTQPLMAIGEGVLPARSNETSAENRPKNWQEQ